MKNIYDVIKESLLDNEDNMIKSLDKSIKDNWLSTYAKGNFKVKDKKSSLGPTIIGKIIIDGYQGDTIPISFWTIKGDIYITNCPNLITIRGLFGDRPISIDGGLYIENCPKLMSLEGCPPIVTDFSCIGNRSIRSLVGAPEHVFGNCYIMKNGKKFTEDQIKASIEVSKRIDCNEEEFEANINESLTEPHLLKLADWLKENKSSLKRLLPINIAFDQITSKDVETYSYPYIDENAIKSCRSIISGKEDGFIIVMNKTGFDCLITSDKKRINLKKPAYSWASFGRSEETKSTELIDICRRAEEVILVRYYSELSTVEKRTQRRSARDGMILNNEYQNREIARENVARYKRLAAKIRAEKNNEFEKIDEEVEKTVMRVLKASQIVHRQPDKYSSYKITTLNQKVYGQSNYMKGQTVGQNGLLYYYAEYTDALIDIKSGHAQSYQLDYEKKCIKEIKRLLEIIDKDLKDLGL